jgi:hypothetical protein
MRNVFVFVLVYLVAECSTHIQSESKQKVSKTELFPTSGETCEESRTDLGSLGKDKGKVCPITGHEVPERE